ncbi:tubulin polyglutamylase TTLL5-like isoform X3 [Apostichopus japonicus]|uniref:tubulin polyglutamylase TTLL5-like isoform X3 n=1 Tax=Stichopus japonicus TaxID=307972 RepID=UPI003AB7A874
MSSISDDQVDDSSCGSRDTGAGNDSDTDSGNSTDSGTASTNNKNSGTDEDCSDEEEDESSDGEQSEEGVNLMWCGPRKSIPIILFRPECMFVKIKRLYAIGEKHHLAYKIVRTDCRVIRQLLHKHGFHEVHPNSSDFNLTWIGCHVKPYTLRSLSEFQKINHFPRSYEITRKDRLYKNFSRLQHSKGAKHFDFLPPSFCTPSEFDDFATAHNRDRGIWIVKPVASSRGRGIFLINHPQNLPMDDQFIVSRYISNPMLVDGFKFDVRLYVAVTSYDPLRIYLYEEGLARFATVQYNSSNKTIRNTCMHLTNYSLNKRSDDYVKCNDPDVEDYGNKWSLGALLRYLKKQGKDVKVLLARIEEVINKVVICAEFPVATACKMFMPNRGNCFELYGFDILIDSNLKPWILEVNLSPSLACDAPIDLKIKSHLMGDLFSLIGFQAQDPMMRKVQQSKRNQELAASSVLRQQKERIGSAFVKQRPQSAGNARRTLSAAVTRPGSGRKSGLSAEERRVAQESKDEYQRRGGWMRIFPTPLSWDKYGNFLECKSGYNQMLHSQLFPDSVLSSTPIHVRRASSSHHVPTAGLLVRSRSIKANHYLLQELQEREIDEHLAQLTRKLIPKDNTSDRKHLRNKIRQRYPAVKQMLNNGQARAGSARHGLPEKKPTNQRENTKEAADNHLNQNTNNKTNTLPRAFNLKQTAIIVTSDKNKGKTKTTANSNQPIAAVNQSSTLPGGDASRSATSNGPISKLAQGQLQEDNQLSNQIEVPEVPPEKLIRDSIDVPNIMIHGGDLTKLQARQAFATYLSRVQQRLLEETSRPPEKLDEAEQNDEQMDLVLRFLKRAAGNLQKPFKVIVPSRKLPIHDRRRILAKQLGDFVQIYSKETGELAARMDTLKEAGQDTDGVVSATRFDKFVVVANEGELEEILTMYTKQNKSASIFLGTGTSGKPSTGNAIGGGKAAIERNIEDKPKAKIGGDDGPKSNVVIRPHSTPNVEEDCNGSTNTGGRRPFSAKAVHLDPAARHFSEGSQQAIQEALQRLAKRQAARQYSPTQNQNLLTQVQNPANPLSGPVLNRQSVYGQSIGRNNVHNSSGKVPHHHRAQSQDSVKVYSEGQRLGSYDYASSQNGLSSGLEISSGSKTSVSSRGSSSSGLQRTLSNPNLLNQTVANQMAWQNESQKAYNTVVGVPPQNGTYQPSPGSLQYHYTVQNMHPLSAGTYHTSKTSRQRQSETRMESQQPMSLQEQQYISHELTQQNRLKHQEQIAAYHTSTTVAVQDALQRHASTTLPYADSSVKRKPHPPSQTCGQSRRPISSQRLARTTQIEDRPNSKFNSISAMTRVYGPHNKGTTKSAVAIFSRQSMEGLSDTYKNKTCEKKTTKRRKPLRASQPAADLELKHKNTLQRRKYSLFVYNVTESLTEAVQEAKPRKLHRIQISSLHKNVSFKRNYTSVSCLCLCQTSNLYFQPFLIFLRI